MDRVKSQPLAIFRALSVSRIRAYAVVRIHPQILWNIWFHFLARIKAQSLTKARVQSLYMFLSLYEAKFSSHPVANVGIIFWLVLSLWKLYLGWFPISDLRL